MIDFSFTTEKRDIRLFSRIVPSVLIIWGTVSGLFIQDPRWTGVAHLWLYGVAVVLFFWGMFSPYTLRPVYIGWMYFTRCVAWFLTTLVLGLVFFIGVTGIGLVMRLLGKDPLVRQLDPAAPSYWIRHRKFEFDPHHYERQF